MKDLLAELVKAWMDSVPDVDPVLRAELAKELYACATTEARRQCRKLGLPDDSANDAAYKLVVRFLHKELDKIRIANARGFLVTFVRHSLLDSMRSMRRSRRTVDVAAAPEEALGTVCSTEDEVLEREDKRTLLGRLQQELYSGVPEDYRLILSRMYLQDWSVDELTDAELLSRGVSPDSAKESLRIAARSAVYQRLSRAKSALRRRLKDVP